MHKKLTDLENQMKQDFGNEIIPLVNQMDKLRERNQELEQDKSQLDKRSMTNSTIFNDKIIDLMGQLDKERQEKKKLKEVFQQY